ncbi:MAG TPA: hypothetical protein VHU84_04595, partial [Lacipirellulaceae bacterium]|nr:hypothetical protein [Lacipirellulaceae bacterium]
MPTKVLTHDCIPGGARDNVGIERLAVAAVAGQSVLVRCPTPPIAAMDELQIRLWVKSNRPDIQLAARIALPRSIDPERHIPMTAIVKGAVYDRPGRWQELVMAGVPKLLEAQVRVLRTMQSGTIDSHEAFLESVVLIVPGDPNGVEVGIDQLEVDGVQIDPAKVAKPTKKKQVAKTVSATKAPPRTDLPVIRSAPTSNAPAPADAKSPVRLEGSMLLVDEKPFFPRAIQWNGEPLQFLAERGFNVIQLASPPTVEQIADAKKYSLWFLCVPPRPESIASSGVGSPDDRVLAWTLEDDAIAADPSYASRWADAIRDRDAVYGRPIVGSPDSNWGRSSKSIDVLLARNSRISRFSERDCEAWLDSRPQFARPGTPIWMSLSSQFSEPIRIQSNALTHASGPAPAVDPEQLETLLQAAYFHGVRGVVFQSGSSLSESDASTRSRAAELERFNRRLQLMEPWLAGGKSVGRTASADAKYEGVVMYVDRARLLVPFVTPAVNPESVKNPHTSTKETTFLVPGVSESSQAYFVTPVSMTVLSLQRVAGGTRVTFPTAADGLVVITEDPQVVQSLRRRISRQAAQSARIERDFTVARVQSVFDNDRRLAALTLKPALNAADIASVNTQLGQMDLLLTAGQLDEAENLIGSITRDSRRMIGDQQRAAGSSLGLQSNAFGLTYNRIADFATLRRSSDGLRGGENLLSGGDFENLNEMTQLGWQHVVHPTAGASTHAELSTDQPEHGAYCLE